MCLIKGTILTIPYPLKLTKQQKQAQEFIQQLIKVCWENPDFKKQLIASPIKTIEKVTGKPNRLPEGIQVEVEDQSNPSIIYLNIPARSNSVF
ncbi:hypothetical protein MNBD_BACTEROID03-1900 [hydrothermal vent metagenome]|uniref:Uncharacterized protein n=1 Tax=hydrothermal vent metagenome TaxID=652676 RepID=A0A3B0T4I0_9ZZZZ